MSKIECKMSYLYKATDYTEKYIVDREKNYYTLVLI
jgi:hypothetical protein